MVSRLSLANPSAAGTRFSTQLHFNRKALLCYLKIRVSGPSWHRFNVPKWQQAALLPVLLFLVADDSAGQRVSVRELGERCYLIEGQDSAPIGMQGQSAITKNYTPLKMSVSKLLTSPNPLLTSEYNKKILVAPSPAFTYFCPILADDEPLEKAFCLWMSTILSVHSEALLVCSYKIILFLYINGLSFNLLHQLKYKKITLDFNGWKQ